MQSGVAMGFWKWLSKPNTPRHVVQAAERVAAEFAATAAKTPDQIRREERWARREREQAEFNRRAAEMDAAQTAEMQQLYNQNQDLIGKFMAIAETKVSVLDEYGDESWDALDGALRACLRKIATRHELTIDWKDLWKAVANTDPYRSVYLYPRTQPLYKLYKRLSEEFKEYHSARREQPTATDTTGLSGVEFETYVARVLSNLGYSVSGTPVTGDQGGDLIARRNGKQIVVQAKRYAGTVGNGAVQEVIGAVSFYSVDEGWVVTNSTFTPSAKALAQKAGIKLIDGAMLAAMETINANNERNGTA
jgi:hypothetical protein